MIFDPLRSLRRCVEIMLFQTSKIATNHNKKILIQNLPCFIFVPLVSFRSKKFKPISDDDRAYRAWRTRTV
jgi:hypothetical protein